MTLTTFTIAGGTLATETGCRLMIGGAFTGNRQKRYASVNHFSQMSDMNFFYSQRSANSTT